MTTFGVQDEGGGVQDDGGGVQDDEGGEQDDRLLVRRTIGFTFPLLK
ncbi:MAG: hypothetical protein RBQ99_01390 [Trichlorobacter sp.]|nr:hypothetical protein [Trichlorobacter sp.]